MRVWRGLPLRFRVVMVRRWGRGRLLLRSGLPLVWRLWASVAMIRRLAGAVLPLWQLGLIPAPCPQSLVCGLVCTVTWRLCSCLRCRFLERPRGRSAVSFGPIIRLRAAQQVLRGAEKTGRLLKRREDLVLEAERELDALSERVNAEAETARDLHARARREAEDNQHEKDRLTVEQGALTRQRREADAQEKALDDRAREVAQKEANLAARRDKITAAETRMADAEKAQEERKKALDDRARGQIEQQKRLNETAQNQKLLQEKLNDQATEQDAFAAGAEALASGLLAPGDTADKLADAPDPNTREIAARIAKAPSGWDRLTHIIQPLWVRMKSNAKQEVEDEMKRERDFIKEDRLSLEDTWWSLSEMVKIFPASVQQAAEGPKQRVLKAISLWKTLNRREQRDQKQKPPRREQDQR